MDTFNNELMEAAEDEEGYDQMNDLTFGDDQYCDDDTDDWEVQHEKLAETLDTRIDLKSSAFRTKQQQVLSDDAGLGCSDDVEYNGYDESDLEHKLSQMVVEEEDEDEREGGGSEQMGSGDTNTRSFHRAIPQRSVNLEGLFGPGSPPGLFQAEELVTGSANIWGSPARQSYMTDQNVVHGLLRSMQTTHPYVTSTPPSVTSTAPSSVWPHQAMTLEEVEQELMNRTGGLTGMAHPGEGGFPVGPGMVPGVGPGGQWTMGSTTPIRTLTVEELEKQLRSDLGREREGLGGERSMEQTGADQPAVVPGSTDLPDLLRHPGILHLPQKISATMPFQKAPPLGSQSSTRVALPMPQTRAMDPQFTGGQWPIAARPGMILPRLPGFGPYPYGHMPLPPGSRQPLPMLITD